MKDETENLTAEPSEIQAEFQGLPALELLTAMRRFASRTFAFALPVVWTLLVLKAAASDSLFLAVPIGGMFPFLFYVGLTFFPRIPLESLAASLSVVVLPVLLIYCSDGNPLWAGGWYLGLGLILLYVRWLPFFVFAAVLLGLHLFFLEMKSNHIEMLWRLDLKHLRYITNPEVLFPAWSSALFLGTVSFFGSRFVVQEFIRLPGMRNSLAAQEKQRTESQGRIVSQEQQIKDLNNQLKKLQVQFQKEQNTLQTTQQELEAKEKRVNELFSQSENQNSEYKRKLQVALTEGIQFRAVFQMDGLLFFRLTESGEILTSNSEAESMVQKLNLKLITSWWTSEQPLLRQAQAHRNWNAFRLMLSRNSELVQVKAANNSTSWVWMSSAQVDALTPERASEWILVAIPVPTERLGLVVQSIDSQPVPESLQRLNMELLNTQRERNAIQHTFDQLVQELPIGMAAVEQLNPPVLLASNALFIQKLLVSDAKQTRWIPALEIQLRKRLERPVNENGISFPLEINYDSPHEPVLHYWIDIRKLETGGPKPQYLVAVQDLTRIHQAESLFEEVAEASPVPFLIAGMNSRKIIYANISLRNALGYSSEELAELAPDDLFVHSNERAQLVLELKREGQIDGFEIEVLDKKGFGHPAVCSLRVSSLLGERCILGSLLLLPPKAVPEQVINTAAVFAVRTVGSWQFAVSTLSLRAEKNLIEYMGWKELQPTTLVKLHDFLARFVAPVDAPILNELISKLVQSETREEIQQIDYRLRNSDNKELVFRIQLKAVWEDDFVTGCIAEHFPQQI